MIKIHEVKKESQADTLGLLSGDVIYEVNNTKIAEPYDFLSELLKAEHKGVLVVFRNDKPFYVEFDLTQPLGISFDTNLDSKKTKYKLNISSTKVLFYNLLWIFILVIIYAMGTLLGVASLFLSLGVLLYAFDAVRFIIDKLESTVE